MMRFLISKDKSKDIVGLLMVVQFHKSCFKND